MWVPVTVTRRFAESSAIGHRGGYDFLLAGSEWAKSATGRPAVSQFLTNPYKTLLTAFCAHPAIVRAASESFESVRHDA
jgi:hypothetical protein